MNQTLFSLQVDFLTPKVFCVSAARKLARLLAGSDILAVQMFIHIWIPSPQKLLWLKSTLRSKSVWFIWLA